MVQSQEVHSTIERGNLFRSQSCEIETWSGEDGFRDLFSKKERIRRDAQLEVLVSLGSSHVISAVGQRDGDVVPWLHGKPPLPF